MNRRAQLIVTVCVVTILIAWQITIRRDRQDLTRQGCPADSATARVAAADLILTGSVFMVTPGVNGADVIVVPETVFRGRLDRPSVSIAALAVSEGSVQSDRQTELSFSSQRPGPYLFFLRERSDGRYTTRRCYGTRLLGSGLTPEETNAISSNANFR